MVIAIIIIILLQYLHFYTFTNLHQDICTKEYKEVKEKVLITDFTNYYLFKTYLLCIIPFGYTIFILNFLIKKK